MLSTVIIFSVLLPIAADEPKVDPAVEQAKRLGIEKPTKAMRFKAIRSKKFDEEYVTVVDEDELKKLDLTPDEVREAMRRAMDDRLDRREDGMVTIEVDQPVKPGESSSEQKRLVCKIRKSVPPKNPYEDSKKPATKKVDMGSTSLSVTSSGACEIQNRGLLDAVKVPNPIT